MKNTRELLNIHEALILGATKLISSTFINPSQWFYFRRKNSLSADSLKCAFDCRPLLTADQYRSETYHQAREAQNGGSNACPLIYFNHKCFTGNLLAISKSPIICS
jgi:hypothetical protein